MTRLVGVVLTCALGVVQYYGIEDELLVSVEKGIVGMKRSEGLDDGGWKMPAFYESIFALTFFVR
jgi:hypothetical protein